MPLGWVAYPSEPQNLQLLPHLPLAPLAPPYQQAAVCSALPPCPCPVCFLDSLRRPQVRCHYLWRLIPGCPGPVQASGLPEGLPYHLLTLPRADRWDGPKVTQGRCEESFCFSPEGVTLQGPQIEVPECHARWHPGDPGAQAKARAPERERGWVQIQWPDSRPSPPSSPPPTPAKQGRGRVWRCKPRVGQDSRGTNGGQRASHTARHPPGPGRAQRMSQEQGLSLCWGQACLCGSPPSSVVLTPALLSLGNDRFS